MRFTPQRRDAAMRRLHHMTASILGVSFAAAAVFGVVAHAVIPGGTTTLSSAATNSGSASTSTSTTTSTSGTSTAAKSASSGSAVAVSGGS